MNRHIYKVLWFRRTVTAFETAMNGCSTESLSGQHDTVTTTPGEDRRLSANSVPQDETQTRDKPLYIIRPLLVLEESPRLSTATPSDIITPG